MLGLIVLMEGLQVQSWISKLCLQSILGADKTEAAEGGENNLSLTESCLDEESNIEEGEVLLTFGQLEVKICSSNYPSGTHHGARSTAGLAKGDKGGALLENHSSSLESIL